MLQVAICITDKNDKPIYWSKNNSHYKKWGYIIKPKNIFNFIVSIYWMR